MSTYTATIRWQSSSPDFLKGKYSREHTWSFDGGITVPASASPAVVPAPYSNPEHVDPEEAFVASVSSCHMLTFLHVAAKRGFQIDSYEDDAVGQVAKNEKGAAWVNLVTLQPKIAYGGSKLPTPAEEEQMHHLAHEQCFIANSIKTEVRVTPNGEHGAAAKGKFELNTFTNDSELARSAAAAWLDEVAAANKRGIPQFVALSGGRIARVFFASIAALAKTRQISLNAVHFFWADERCVPPTDTESSFRVAQEFLFEPLKIPEGQIHRIRGEDTPDLAASEAEAEIRRFVKPDPDGQPVLDLIFLGMGEDGHVASLFPGEPEVVRSSKSIYRAVTGTKPPPRRVTLGYNVIAAARQVWVLISGSGKAAALRESLDSSGHTPLARVIQSRPLTRVYSDILLK